MRSGVARDEPRSAARAPLVVVARVVAGVVAAIAGVAIIVLAVAGCAARAGGVAVPTGRAEAPPRGRDGQKREGAEEASALPCPAGARARARAAARDTRATAGDARGECFCDEGLDLLAGACVTAAEAARYCGPAARWEGTRCVVRVCAGDRPLDRATGACTSARDLRARARGAGLSIRDDQELACRAGATLVARGERVACLPDAAARGRAFPVIDGETRGEDVRADRTARDARPGDAAHPALRCPVGAVAAGDRCEPLIVRGASGDAVTVDVSRWATALLGTDGGAGSAFLCAPLVESPGALGVPPGARGAVRIDIQLTFPDNDITQLVDRTRAVDDSDPRAPHALGREAEGAVRDAEAPLFSLLRALGGTASAAAVTRTVRCALDGGVLPSPSVRSPPALSPSVGANGR